jgi:hypothetical protein
VPLEALMADPYDDRVRTNPYNVPVPEGFSFGTNPFGSPGDLYERAYQTEHEERRRQGVALGGLESEFAGLKDSLSKGIDTSLLFSRATDATGLRARGMMDRLRQSIGGRGIDPNSGAAGGLLSRIAMQQDNANVGAMRDIAIEDSRDRAARAGQLFTGALNLFQARNQPLPSALLDTALNQSELDLAREGLASQERMTKDANKKDFFSGLIKGGLSLAGAAF